MYDIESLQNELLTALSRFLGEGDTKDAHYDQHIAILTKCCSLVFWYCLPYPQVYPQIADTQNADRRC
jgi:hypothetical protein